MNKTLKTLTTIVTSLLVGCSTIGNLTPSQVATVGTVITQASDEGAVYAIQQNKGNATYFVLADQVLDNFANGTDLSPTSLQIALAKIDGTNQLVNLAISGAVTAYDLSYSQYISNQLSNSPVAKVWILDVETGFKQALATTGTGLSKVSKPTTSRYVKSGVLDKATLAADIKAARK